ncbi:endopolyphosphatase [Mycena galericulata]|nr:endopolyphosphatase [Mycena galericulata]
MLLTTCMLLLWTGLVDVSAAPQQVPFQVPVVAKPRKLHGRFLQVTDIHPDPFYRQKTSEATACHRKKGKKKKKNRAGYYGLPYSDCDSPLRLTNFTLDFIEKKWASEIDFVIWTGDNARHDSDRKLPRTPSEIYDLNRAVATKMASIFTSRGIPVVPSLGNNDVWPHNIMIPGPNSITNEFASIWKAFIPFPHLQIFQRGAYYAVEVVPDSLAVISLNTMYFYDSNKAVGGCEFKDREDAGNLEFDWLEVQLKGFRARGMQVWITGHVPPSPGNYFPECYVRYVELALRFQDTILGHLYGHMNADHFFFLEADDLALHEPQAVTSKEDLFETLIADFAAMPKAKNVNLDNYAVINVSPSVVPNPYLPSFRVFSYNVTGAATSLGRKHGHPRGGGKDKEKQCKLDAYRETWRCQLNESWHSDPDAPSRSNQLWTPLGYAQYYIPHLEEGNKTHEPSFKLEYVTYGRGALEGSDGVYPVPLKNLPSHLKKKQTPYKLEDLTVGAWIALARQMGNSTKLSSLFKTYMYMA